MPTYHTGYVYWVHDGTCLNIATEGYVGVTVRLEKRRKSHARRFPNTSMTIIFEGPIHECYDVERMLRPNADIGWNKAVGGKRGFFAGGRYGRPHPWKGKKLPPEMTRKRLGHAAYPKQREMARLCNQKTYRVMSPTREEMIVTNLAQFCRERELRQSNIVGRYGSNGWRAKLMLHPSSASSPCREPQLLSEPTSGSES